jgi:hypothetical protein
MVPSQSSLPANQNKSDSPDASSARPTIGVVRCDRPYVPSIDESGDQSGHTLLSRPAAPQGRKSLFRR